MGVFFSKLGSPHYKKRPKQHGKETPAPADSLVTADLSAPPPEYAESDNPNAECGHSESGLEQCVCHQASAVPVADVHDSLLAIAVRTCKVPPANRIYRSRWTSQQEVLYGQATVFCGDNTFRVNCETWDALIKLWLWLVGGKNQDEADQLLVNFDLQENQSFLVQLAKLTPKHCNY